MKNLPPIRSENILMQEIGGEILVYDLLTNKSFCLNETSAKIYNACGDHQTFSDLKAKYSLSDDLIYFALDELEKNNLLAEEYISPRKIFCGKTPLFLSRADEFFFFTAAFFKTADS